MNKLVKQLIILVVALVIVGFGASLTMKAAVGIGAYDAAAMSVSKVLGIKVGTISMFENILCTILQILILRKGFKKAQLLQFGLAILVGASINFSYYILLNQLLLNSYVPRLLVLLCGYIIAAFAVGIIMAINVISTPLEGLCLAIAELFKINFGKVRQGADILLIVAVIILTFTFKLSLSIREGTIIGMLMFGPLLDKFIRILKPQLIKYEIL